MHLIASNDFYEILIIYAINNVNLYNKNHNFTQIALNILLY